MAQLQAEAEGCTLLGVVENLFGFPYVPYNSKYRYTLVCSVLCDLAMKSLVPTTTLPTGAPSPLLRHMLALSQSAKKSRTLQTNGVVGVVLELVP